MRHRRHRKIFYKFKKRFYKPNGIPALKLEEVVLTPSELETLRLRYLEGLSQVEAAEKMGISQSQFQRDLWQAITKITDAKISGKAIRISE